MKLTDIDNLSFENIVQQIENRFNDLNNQLVELQDAKSKLKVDGDTGDLQKHTDTLQVDDIPQSNNTQTEDHGNHQSQQVGFLITQHFYYIFLIDSNTKSCS